MTALLEKVFKKASTLSEEVQDMVANELLQEIEWESRWDKTLEKSQNALDILTLKAMAEYKSGKTKEKGFDEL